MILHDDVPPVCGRRQRLWPATSWPIETSERMFVVPWVSLPLIGPQEGLSLGPYTARR